MEGMSTIAKVVSESRPEDVQHLAQEARKQVCLEGRGESGGQGKEGGTRMLRASAARTI